MQFVQHDNTVIATDLDSFNIKEILECGQCFRFQEIENLYYKIIAYNKVLYIKQDDKKVTFFPMTISEMEDIWINYFDLNTDYSAIKSTLSSDPILKEAINFAPGIRILNQQPYECLISFIISQNNRIPMIKQVIKNISEKYGTKLDEDYLFPDLNQLYVTNLDELSSCKTGFRNKYILDALENIKNKTIDFDNFSQLSTTDAKETLLKINGVGTKVADCVLLFSLERKEVFPTDVWIKRVMEYYYFDGKDTPIKKIHSFATEKWGNLAGFAQQYLFYYARSQKIGTK